MIDHSPIDCTLVKQQVVLYPLTSGMLKPQDLILQAMATCEALSDCSQSPVPRQGRVWIGPTVPTVEENRLAGPC